MLNQSMDGERRFLAHPQSAPGDFYVVNHGCTACGAPHVVAPDLIGWAEQDGVEMDHCIWKKQPETPAEWAQAFAAFDASCVGCYRYAGADPTVMARIGTEFCDHLIPVRVRRLQAVYRNLPEPKFTLLNQRRSAVELLWAGVLWLVRRKR